MDFGRFMMLFGIAFGVFLVVDLIWLIFVARKFYKNNIGYIMTDKVVWPAAIIFYVIFVLGLTYFVIYPATSWSNAMLNGALLGFIGYATYDLTNLSTLKGWPLKVTIVDLIWGTSLGAVITVVTFLIAGV